MSRWDAAVAKLKAEGRCRGCGNDADHLRAVSVLTGDTGDPFVPPAAIVPLCPACEDTVPLGRLTPSERLHAIARLTEEAA